LREKANPVLAAMTKDADEMGHFLPEGYVQQENLPVGMWKFSGRVNRKFACKQMHEVTWMTSPTFPQCNPVKQEVAPLFGLQNSFLTFSSFQRNTNQKCLQLHFHCRFILSRLLTFSTIVFTIIDDLTTSTSDTAVVASLKIKFLIAERRDIFQILCGKVVSFVPFGKFLSDTYLALPHSLDKIINPYLMFYFAQYNGCKNEMEWKYRLTSRKSPIMTGITVSLRGVLSCAIRFVECFAGIWCCLLQQVLIAQIGIRCLERIKLSKRQHEPNEIDIFIF
jgi:hypothetical protein